MTVPRFVRHALTTASAALLATLLTAGGALAQSPAGPSAQERAITLASPGVVFIDTSVSVKVLLTYNKSTSLSGLGHLNKTYAFDYATGSGFAINPNGTIVTASHVVEPDEQQMRNYAANKLVLEGLNYTYPNSSSSPFDQYTLPVHSFDVLLHQCYKGIACDFTITPIVTVFSAVDVAQQTLPKGEAATVLASTGFSDTDVAVLKVNATNMPTIALAGSAGDLSTGAEVTALGFPGSSRDALQSGTTEPTKVFGHVSNVRHESTGDLVEIDANTEPGMSGGPVINDQGQVIGLTSFALLQSSGQTGAKYLRTVDEIKAVVSQAGVTAARGPADTSFQTAMDLFWGHHYTAAIPELNRTLALDDGHPLAKQYLAQAQQKRGTAADVPIDTGSSLPIVPIAVGVAVLVIVVIAAIAMSKRKKPAVVATAGPAYAPTSPTISAPAPTPMPAPTPPAPLASTPVADAPAATTPQTPVDPSPPAPPADPAPMLDTPAVEAPAGEMSAADAPEPSDERVATRVEGGVHFCPNCGTKVIEGAHFCPNCGQKLQ